MQGGRGALFARRQERAGESVGEELRDDGGFSDDFVFIEEARDGVGDGWNEAAGVEVEVPLRAGGVEVDNDFRVG